MIEDKRIKDKIIRNKMIEAERIERKSVLRNGKGLNNVQQEIRRLFINHKCLLMISIMLTFDRTLQKLNLIVGGWDFDFGISGSSGVVSSILTK